MATCSVRVYGVQTIPVSMVVAVEVEDITDHSAITDAAIEAASAEWPGIEEFVGNGRVSGALVGVTDKRARVSASNDAPEWDHELVEVLKGDTR